MPFRVHFRFVVQSGRLAEYDGISICDVRVHNENEEEFCQATKNALEIIRKNDLRRYHRIKREIRWIVNTELLTIGNYGRLFRICSIDFFRYSQGEDKHAFLKDYACTLVHEATHGRIFTYHIAYTRKLRIRIEKLCRLEELRFAKRIGHQSKELDPNKPMDLDPWIKLWKMNFVERVQKGVTRLKLEKLILTERRAYKHYERENFERAEPLFREAVALRKELQGEDDKDYLMSLNLLGATLSELEKFDEAETIYLKALERQQRLLGENHLDTTYAKQNLGVLYYDMERYEVAESLHRDVLHIREQQLGEDNISTLNTVESLAGLLASIGRTDEAVHLYERALSGKRVTLGEDDPEVEEIEETLGELKKQQ